MCRRHAARPWLRQRAAAVGNRASGNSVPARFAAESPARTGEQPDPATAQPLLYALVSVLRGGELVCDGVNPLSARLPRGERRLREVFLE